MHFCQHCHQAHTSTLINRDMLLMHSEIHWQISLCIETHFLTQQISTLFSADGNCALNLLRCTARRQHGIEMKWVLHFPAQGPRNRTNSSTRVTNTEEWEEEEVLPVKHTQRDTLSRTRTLLSTAALLPL